jgi:hypothetical protein
MKTYEEDDGAVFGKHTVTITKVEMSSTPGVDQDSPEYVPPELSNAPPPTLKNAIPAKYGSPASSGLTAEVSDSGPSEFKFELAD